MTDSHAEVDIVGSSDKSTVTKAYVDCHNYVLIPQFDFELTV